MRKNPLVRSLPCLFAMSAALGGISLPQVSQANCVIASGGGTVAAPLPGSIIDCTSNAPNPYIGLLNNSVADVTINIAAGATVQTSSQDLILLQYGSGNVIDVAAGGTIAASQYGIVLDQIPVDGSGGSITNAGTISAAYTAITDYGPAIPGPEIRNTGEISGGENGIYLSHRDISVSNEGSSSLIRGITSTALRLGSNANTLLIKGVYNEGQIIGGFRGLALDNVRGADGAPVVVTNAVGALIQGGTSHGLSVSGGADPNDVVRNISVNNAGTIRSIGAQGVAMSAFVPLINTGTITAGGGEGVFVTRTNITPDRAGELINNSGTITGTTSGLFLESLRGTGGDGMLVVTNTGTIQGASGSGLLLRNGDGLPAAKFVQIVNSGAISGTSAVSLGTPANLTSGNELVLISGAQNFSLGGNLINLGGNTVYLEGSNIHTEDSAFTGFTTGGALVKRASGDWILSAAVSGGPAIRVQQGGLTLNGAVSATTTEVGGTEGQAARLFVNGTLTGSVTVNTDGRLAGGGQVGATTVNSQGTIAPGNSIGTLTINGDFAPTTGALYEAEVDKTGGVVNNDRIVVNGTAALAGDLKVIATGDYGVGDGWIILSASTLSGAFANVSYVDAGGSPINAYNFVVDYLAIPNAVQVRVASVGCTSLVSGAGRTIAAGETYSCNDGNGITGAGANTISNAGTLFGQPGTSNPVAGGIALRGDGSTVNNDTTGVIAGGNWGVALIGSNHTVNNSGVIGALPDGTTATVGIAISTDAGPATGNTITNDGQIVGTDVGVQSNGTGNTITNHAGASITGSTGIVADGADTIDNQGDIDGLTGPGIIAGTGATITNTGTVTGGADEAVIMTGAGTLTLRDQSNLEGSLQAAGSAVFLDGTQSSQEDDELMGVGTLTKQGPGDWTLDSVLGSDAATTRVEAGQLLLRGGYLTDLIEVAGGKLVVDTAIGGVGAGHVGRTEVTDGTLEIGTGRTLTTDELSVDGGAVDLDGTLTAANTGTVGGSGVVTVRDGGKLTGENLTLGADGLVDVLANGAFEAHRLTQTGGTARINADGVLTTDTTLLKGGAFSVAHGASFNAGLLRVETGATQTDVSGNGSFSEVEVAGGTLNLTALANVGADLVSVESGTLSLAATGRVVTDALEVTDGAADLSGDLTALDHAWIDGGVVTVQDGGRLGGPDVQVRGGTLDVQEGAAFGLNPVGETGPVGPQNMTLSGGLFQLGGTWNEPTALFSMSGGQGIVTATGVGQVDRMDQTGGTFTVQSGGSFTVATGSVGGGTAGIGAQQLGDALLDVAGTIAGGPLTIHTGGEFSLTGTSTLTTIEVAGGYFVANGDASASTVSVTGEDAELTGNGSLGGTTLTSGTLAPGNVALLRTVSGPLAPTNGDGIGTLVVNGDFRQEGGIYEADIAADGRSDLLEVNGSAVIANGTLRLNAIDPIGAYGDITALSYTVLYAFDINPGWSDAAIVSPFLGYRAVGVIDPGEGEDFRVTFELNDNNCVVVGTSPGAVPSPHTNNAALNCTNNPALTGEADAVITNNGTAQGTIAGVLLGERNQLTNTGTIIGTAGPDVLAQGAGSTITNTGTIGADPIPVDPELLADASAPTVAADGPMAPSAGRVAVDLPNGGTLILGDGSILNGSVQGANDTQGNPLATVVLEGTDASPGNSEDDAFHAVNLTKRGTGAWTLTGTITEAGTLRVDQGSLALGGTVDSDTTQVEGGTLDILNGAALGTETLAVNAGALGIAGNGSVEASEIGVHGGTLTAAQDSLLLSWDLVVDGGQADLSGVAWAQSSTRVSGGLVTVLGSGSLETGDLELSDGTLQVQDDGDVFARMVSITGGAFTLSGEAYVGAGSLHMTAGTLSLADTAFLSVPYIPRMTAALAEEPTPTALLQVDGGTLTAGDETLIVAQQLTVGGSGLVELTGDAMLVAGNALVTGGAVTMASGAELYADETLDMTGGTIDVGGGVLTVGFGEAAARLEAAPAQAAPGLLTMTGGLLSVGTGGSLRTQTTEVQGGQLDVNNGGTFAAATLLEVGGTGVVNFAGSMYDGTPIPQTNIAAGGTLTVLDGGVFATDALALNGGTLSMDPGGALETNAVTQSDGLFRLCGTWNAPTARYDLNGGQAVVTGTGVGHVDVLNQSGGTFAIREGGVFTVNTGNLTGGYMNVGGTLAGNALNVNGAGVLNLLDTGTTTVATITVADGGLAVINGDASASDVVIDDGGTVEGAGQLRTLINRGVIAPGNSIGTLTVNGDYTHASTATYENEINADGRADLIRVTGSITLQGGTLRVLAEPGNFGTARDYLVMDAAGGISGDFANFSISDPTLSFRTLVLPNLYLLRVGGPQPQARSAPTPLPEVADTPNQAQVANALYYASGVSSDFAEALIAVQLDLEGDENAQRLALDSMSGELYATTEDALLRSSDRFMQVVGAQASGQDVIHPAAVMDGGGAGADGAWATKVWLVPYGHWGSIDGDGNATGVDYSVGGLAAGVDTAITSQVSLGVALGYSQTGVDADRSFIGSSDADGLHLGGYAAFAAGAFKVRGTLAYTWYDVDLSRGIVIGDNTRRATGSYDATEFAAGAEATYDLQWRNTLVQPLLAVSYHDLDQDGVTEQGAGGLNLAVSGSSFESLTTTLGARISTEIKRPNGWQLKPEARLGWRHEFMDTVPEIGARFTGATGAPGMLISGAPVDTDAAEVRLALTAAHPHNGSSLYLAYDGLLGSEQTENAISAGVKLIW